MNDGLSGLILALMLVILSGLVYWVTLVVNDLQVQVVSLRLHQYRQAEDVVDLENELEGLEEDVTGLTNRVDKAFDMLCDDDDLDDDDDWEDDLLDEDDLPDDDDDLDDDYDDDDDDFEDELDDDATGEYEDNTVAITPPPHKPCSPSACKGGGCDKFEGVLSDDAAVRDAILKAGAAVDASECKATTLDAAQPVTGNTLKPDPNYRVWSDFLKYVQSKEDERQKGKS